MVHDKANINLLIGSKHCLYVYKIKNGTGQNILSTLPQIKTEEYDSLEFNG